MVSRNESNSLNFILKLGDLKTTLQKVYFKLSENEGTLLSLLFSINPNRIKNAL